VRQLEKYSRRIDIDVRYFCSNKFGVKEPMKADWYFTRKGLLAVSLK